MQNVPGAMVREIQRALQTAGGAGGPETARQLLLDGFDPPSPPNGGKPVLLPSAGGDKWSGHAFYLMARLEEPANGCFYRLGHEVRAKQGLKGKLRPRRNLHITLFGLGEYQGPDEHADYNIGRAMLAASDLRYPTFEVSMDRVTRFGGGAVVAAGAEGVATLLDFHERLRTSLARHQLLFAAGFTPHVTLLYGVDEPFEYAVAPITWTVRNFSLVRSDIGKSRYTNLRTWPLIERS